MRGRIVRSTGSWYTVHTDEGKTLEVRLKGKFRLEGKKSTNPVAVGDYVILANEEDSNSVVIDEIEERNNYLSRQSPKNRFSRHIIAANLDQAVVMATIAKPRTSSGFIDRFIATAEAFHIPAHIIFNKQDILREKDLIKQEDFIQIYESIGYQVHLTSAETGEGIEEIKTLFDGKTSLIAGHSGVGKSTLINAIDPSFELRTGDISRKHKKGMHTTTYAEMFKMPGGGYIIDTPGIKEFGMLDVEPEEVGHYFVEMRPLIGECKFNNCLHLEEPGCAVVEAIEQGEIDPERYKNYINIVIDSQNKVKHWE